MSEGTGTPSHLLARFGWPGSAEHLALVRIVLGAFLVSVFLSPAIPILLEIPGGLFPETKTWLPFELEKLVLRFMWPLLHSGLLSAICVCLGLFTRVMLPVLLVSYVLTQNFYYRSLTAHDDWIYFTFFVLVLCFAPCADALALDRVIARLRKRPAPESEPQSYRWPIELMTSWVSLVYFAAGLAKLFPLRKGLVWLNGGSAQRMAMYYLPDSPLYFVLGGTAFNYSLRWPFLLMSVGAVAIELFAISMLFSRRTVPYALLGILAMHLGIYCFGIMGFTTLALVASPVLLDPLSTQRTIRRLLPSSRAT